MIGEQMHEMRPEEAEDAAKAHEITDDLYIETHLPRPQFGHEQADDGTEADEQTKGLNAERAEPQRRDVKVGNHAAIVAVLCPNAATIREYIAGVKPARAVKAHAPPLGCRIFHFRV